MNEGNRVPPEPDAAGAAGTTPAGSEPVRPATAPEAVAGGTGVVPATGDFELARPVPVPADAGAPAGETGTGESAWSPAAERPGPLHDPDPYSTPPYGEPGPWAPAPPVQHPSTTPAQGTTVLPPGMPTAPAPVPVAPEPAPGTAVVPPGMPAAMPVASAPVPGGPETAHDTAVPAPRAAAFAPASPASAPAPPAAASLAPEVAHATPVPDPGASGPEPEGRGPWGRYDPWAVGAAPEQPAGPLQQTGAAVATAGQRRRRARRLAVGWTLLVACVSAAVGGVAGAYVEREGLGGEVHLPQAGSVPAGRAPDSVAGIASRALPSVVTLHVTGADEAGTGTGFVLDGQGHILTNNHVVEPAGSGGEISVTFSTGDTVKAKVVGRDSGYDLAVVQVHGVHGLTPLPLGDSDDVRVGDPVVAIGAPFDLANTVTSGIISAKERPITAGGEKGDGSDVSYVDALQTDAPINPGNSGGPLLDSRARVVGINSAIRSAGSGSGSDGGQAGSIGLGFAIPVNQARRVAEELINDGRATHPVIGVTLDMGYTGDGARIDDRSAGGGPAVIKGGPGERAGLQGGDVITEVGQERVHSAEELIVKIRAHRPGDRLRLTVEREGTDREVSLVLGASEQN
ncbi:trypsin-like peptidase domain-containing protein [Streptomyces albidocamelliae]|uniref:Trypsin-like peptidase domain-containing protein n=1 Tax=Streptomyces albidocamelliae TaxID=2981135 RepID=A0ABY6ETH1_9ACTN|nr:trypsin-like peptidase domain-containing protein [Streptomyces sp. HUAS 14-6]UXY37660.1 trypsin-like peptidase domain-containing protein [Streptomyces sp. HUAS 14-6]